MNTNTKNRIRRFQFNKLFRDKDFSTFTRAGATPHTIELNPEDFIEALKERLVEEAIETAETATAEDMFLELADLQEVINALMKATGLSKEKLEELRATKEEKRGSFTTPTYVLYVDFPEGHPYIEHFEAKEDRYPELPVED